MLEGIQLIRDELQTQKIQCRTAQEIGYFRTVTYEKQKIRICKTIIENIMMYGSKLFVVNKMWK